MSDPASECLQALHDILFPYCEGGMELTPLALAGVLSILQDTTTRVNDLEVEADRLRNRNDALERSIRRQHVRPTLGEIARRVIAAEKTGKVVVFNHPRRPTPFDAVQIEQRAAEMSGNNTTGFLTVMADMLAADTTEKFTTTQDEIA